MNEEKWWWSQSHVMEGFIKLGKHKAYFGWILEGFYWEEWSVSFLCEDQIEEVKMEAEVLPWKRKFRAEDDLARLVAAEMKHNRWS